jgi:hypothetical protein
MLAQHSRLLFTPARIHKQCKFKSCVVGASFRHWKSHARLIPGGVREVPLDIQPARSQLVVPAVLALHRGWVLSGCRAAHSAQGVIADIISCPGGGDWLTIGCLTLRGVGSYNVSIVHALWGRPLHVQASGRQQGEDMSFSFMNHVVQTCVFIIITIIGRIQASFCSSICIS